MGMVLRNHCKQQEVIGAGTGQRVSQLLWPKTQAFGAPAHDDGKTQFRDRTVTEYIMQRVFLSKKAKEFLGANLQWTMLSLGLDPKLVEN
jgi:hypothetical protein